MLCCLRQQSQIAGSFLQLVRSLNALHLQPQRGLSSEAEGGNANDSSSSSNQQGTEQEEVLAEFHRKVAALQGGQVQSHISQWLKADAARQQIDSSRHSSFRPNPAAGAAAAGGLDAQEGGGLGAQVDPDYGYAVLGGIDPSSSQQVAGAQQPKLHPTRNFDVRDMYDPKDLSPLAAEEEETWVPTMRRGHREVPPPVWEVRKELDYKNIDFLLNFVSASGRLKGRRQTRLKPRLQSKVARTVKLARQMALIPYEMRVGDGGGGDSWRRSREFRAAETAAFER